MASVGYYFPPGTFSPDNAEHDSFTQEWYGGHLHSMEEPRLFQFDDPGLAVYRFTCLPSFDHPYTIRINKTRTGSRLTIKLTSGFGGYHEGPLIVDESADLAPSEWRKLKYEIGLSRYWCMPSTERGAGCDGEQWIVEAYDCERYHVVDRWSPSRGPYKRLCDFFVEVSEKVVAFPVAPDRSRNQRRRAR